MELSATTFLFEIVNFLVLIWILQRFLYRPVRDVVARRQAAIAKTVGDAEAMKTEATALQERYRNRLDEWQREKQTARLELKSELDAERARALAAVEQELAEERQRADALEEKRRADCLREYQRLGLLQGSRFAAALLGELAGPELEARLVRLALERLATLPEAAVDGIRLACEGSPEEASVATAFPLTEDLRNQLHRRLSELLGMVVACRFREDAALLAGISITLGPWVFHANLRDELKAFVDAPSEAV
ncbi:MAG: ATPase [Methylococcaceae bacterium]|nr:ATPase [Methylococcaceae bacterium]